MLESKLNFFSKKNKKIKKGSFQVDPTRQRSSKVYMNNNSF